jgi:hypothetical protein
MIRRSWPTVRKVGPIVLLVLVGTFFALVSKDAAAVRQGMERSDLAFEALPAAEKLWRLDTVLPGTETALGVDDDLVYRRALRKFAVDDRRRANPYDFSRPAFRAEAQAALLSAERSGLSPERRSKLALLQGVLTYDEAIADPVNGPHLMRQVIDHFQRAVRIDPANEEAKYDLELIFRLLDPSAKRLRIRQNIPAFAAGRNAPGGGPNTQGYGY